MSASMKTTNHQTLLVSRLIKIISDCKSITGVHKLVDDKDVRKAMSENNPQKASQAVSSWSNKTMQQITSHKILHVRNSDTVFMMNLKTAMIHLILWSTVSPNCANTINLMIKAESIKSVNPFNWVFAVEYCIIISLKAVTNMVLQGTSVKGLPDHYTSITRYFLLEYVLEEIMPLVTILSTFVHPTTIESSKENMNVIPTNIHTPLQYGEHITKIQTSNQWLEQVCLFKNGVFENTNINEWVDLVRNSLGHTNIKPLQIAEFIKTFKESQLANTSDIPPETIEHGREDDFNDGIGGFDRESEHEEGAHLNQDLGETEVTTKHDISDHQVRVTVEQVSFPSELPALNFNAISVLEKMLPVLKNILDKEFGCLATTFDRRIFQDPLEHFKYIEKQSDQGSLASNFPEETWALLVIVKQLTLIISEKKRGKAVSNMEAALINWLSLKLNSGTSQEISGKVSLEQILFTMNENVNFMSKLISKEGDLKMLKYEREQRSNSVRDSKMESSPLAKIGSPKRSPLKKKRASKKRRRTYISKPYD